MRKMSKFISMLLVLVVMIFGCGQNVSAAESVQGNARVGMELQKNEQTEEYDIDVHIGILNEGYQRMENISVETILPEGLEFIEGETGKWTGEVMKPGDAENLFFNVKIEEKQVEDGSEDENENSSNQGKDNNANDNSHNKDNNSNKVETGDITNTSLLIVFVIGTTIGVGVVVKDKKNRKRLLSFFLCVTLASSALIDFTVSAQSEEGKMVLSEEIEVDGEKYVIQVHITYDEVNDVVRPSGKTISRGEWLSKLSAVMEYDDSEIVQENIEPYFDDIEGTEWEKSIIWAASYGIVNTGEESFYPDIAATREFAAVTAVKALGIQPQKELECQDAGEIRESLYVESAVFFEIFKLDQNNCFYPARELTESEAKVALDVIAEMVGGMEVNPDYDSKIEFQNQVLQFAEGTEYRVENNIVVFQVNEETKKLKKDIVFVLPDYTPYKVVDVQEKAGELFVETKEPAMEETIQNIDFQQSALLDWSNFIPAEGVTMENPKNRAWKPEIPEISGTLPSPGEITFTIDHEIAEGVKVEGSTTIGIKEVDVAFQGFWLPFGITPGGTWYVKKAYMNMPMENNLKIGIKTENESKWEPKKDKLFTLGKIPVVGIPGVTVYVEVGVGYTLEGGFHFIYQMNAKSFGVEITKNRCRGFQNIKNEITFTEIEGSFKVGPKVKGLLEVCKTWDLIDIGAFGGGAVEAKMSIRDTGLVCIDANTHIFLEMSALKEALIGKWLDVGWTKELLNEDNSPLRQKFHIENLKFVHECTYGKEKAVIKGKVAMASDHSQTIKNADIKIRRDSDDKVYKETHSDKNGKYEVDVAPGTYKIEVSAKGYITFYCREKVEDGEKKQLETYLMVKEGNKGEQGVAEGTIKDAVTGEKLKDVKISVRKDWGVTEGKTVATTTTGEDGKYFLQLPLGNYTIVMEKADYVTNHKNIVVQSGITSNQDANMIPKDTVLPKGDLRVVLTWGATPEDLDSHMVGPTDSGDSSFHIAYYNRTIYGNDGELLADLDLDDTNSYGPETTTVYRENKNGLYKFYIHDYSNSGNYQSKAMSNSGAKVQVYKGEKLVKTYHIPPDHEGVYWHVFDYDPVENKIITINKYENGI